MAGRTRSKLKQIIPPLGFFRAWIMKVFSLLISIKVHILTVTTGFFIFDMISQSTWSHVIISIALGNVVISVVEVYKDQTDEEVNLPK